MTELIFSNPILLGEQNQSIVIDHTRYEENNSEETETEKTVGVPLLINYKLVTETNGDKEEKKIKYGFVKLQSNRKFEIIQSIDNFDTAAEKLKGVVDYTVKSLPSSGIYGYVKYKNGQVCSFQKGLGLNNARQGGDIFSETD